MTIETLIGFCHFLLKSQETVTRLEGRLGTVKNTHTTARILSQLATKKTMASLEVESLEEHLASCSKRTYDLFVEDNADE